MKYDVYGIGNALVDIVTEVNDQFLETYSIEKGFMTLVDADRQFQLVEAINLKESNMQCGGSAANTIIAACQFGARGYYSCLVADDDMGHFYIKDLVANHVSTNMMADHLPQGITGKCLVMTTPDAGRTMNTFLGITSSFSKDQINVDALRESRYLYMEGYLVTSENGVEAMIEARNIARENDVKTVLTFSDPSMVKYFNDQMHQVIEGGVDMLFCNEEEARLFTGTNTIGEAREELKKYAKKFAITLGANGAILFDGDTFIDIEPYKVEAVDTNGAGDMFAGAFLYGVTHGHSFIEAGKIASLASSQVVSQFGPRLKKKQTQSILNHLFE
jgi:sugar/nucleoside kinase (ribokinase family)